MLIIQYLGQCGFLLDFGDVRLVTDPYLTDYVDQNCATSDLPWKRAYPPQTTLKDLKPNAILISHAHEDHMDPWTFADYVKDGRETSVILPKPESPKLREWGYINVLPAQADEPIHIKGITITPIPCAHTQLHRDENGDYHELSYFIEGYGKKLFFAGDMSIYPGLIQRLKAENPEIVLLPANGSTPELTSLGIIGNISCYDAAAITVEIQAKAFIPMHHDLYEKVNGCSIEEIERACEACHAPLLVLKPYESRMF